MAHYCEHPLWRMPNPLPRDGDVCPVPDCEIRYRRPAWMAGLTEDEIQGVRVYWEIAALWLLVQEGLMDRREALVERRRLARSMGWEGMLRTDGSPSRQTLSTMEERLSLGPESSGE